MAKGVPKMRGTKTLLASATALTAMALAACAPSETEATSETSSSELPAMETKVTVGIITSETGVLAGYGEQYLAGFRAGLDYATDGTNKVGDTTIEIDYRDDAGDVDKAVTITKELIGAGVNIIAGTVSSGVALSVAEQAEQNEVLYISGPAAADAMTGLNDYTFRSGRQSSQDVGTAGTFLDDVEGKEVLVFAQDSAFGQGNVAAVEAILGAQGASVDSLLVAEDVTEFTTFAQQVVDADPDLVFVAWAGATSGAMWEAMSQQDVFASIPVVTGLGDAATYGAYGAASEQISFLNHYFPGGPSNEVNDAMVAAIEAEGGSADLFSPDGFNAALMIVHAVEAGYDDVDAMIAALEGWTFDGPKGTTTIRESDHALIQEMYQVTLVADGDSYVPELLAVVPAEDVAPAEATE